MITVLNKTECCGCEACSNICPKNSITMTADEEGFFYPKVNFDVCINCHLCENICPMTHYHEPSNELCVTYAGRTKKVQELEYVASGGIYTAIAEQIVEMGGYAIGAQYKDGRVQHVICDDACMIINQSSSKYVQSWMGSNYQQIKKLLVEDKTVLFSGTPCQIVALIKYLNKPYNNLYIIEVLCAGVTSPKVFEQYKVLLETKNRGSKIDYINFKRKTYGYHSSTMYLHFNNGKSYSRSRLIDEMMHVFTTHIADRPSCSVCPFKGINRMSDMTLFDCWHYCELTGEIDDDKGYTNVVVHTKKGLSLLKQYDILRLKEIDTEKAIFLDGNMFHGVQKHHPSRDSFFYDLNSEGLQTAIKRNCPITIKDRIGEKSKGLLYRLGLLDAVKKIYK